MKKKLFRKSILAVTVAAAMTLGFAACSSDDKKDKPKPDDEIVLDGLYFQSEGSALKTLSAKGMLKSTKNEVDQKDRVELKEIYVAMEANSEFKLVEVKGADRITYGPGEGFGEVEGEDLDGEEPQLGLQKGSIIDTDTPFTVKEEGLYHIVFDTELNVGAIAKADWGVIGSATEGAWSSSTNLSSDFDLNKIEFKGEVDLLKGEYKFRYSNGWKIFLSEEPVVNANTSIGGAIDNLEYSSENLSNLEPAKYSITFIWELGEQFKLELEKGEEIIIDQSQIEMGLIGNVYYNAAGELEDWGTNYPGKNTTPKVDGDIYTYEFLGLELVPGEFKFREGEDWKGEVGFGSVELKGDAVDSIDPESSGNFILLEEGTYDFYLEYDNELEKFTTLTINKK